MSVTPESPSPIFTDITEKIEDMKSDLDTNTLGSIMRSCNKYMVQSVLCPWGEAEFIHQCGNIPYDTVLQRYLPKCYVHKVHLDKLCLKDFSTRDDDVREPTDYEDILLNPSWDVLPCLAFIEGKGPQVLTCREHNGGTSKQYVHTPDNLTTSFQVIWETNCLMLLSKLE